MNMFNHRGEGRSLLRDLAWGLRKIGFYAAIMAVAGFLGWDQKSGDVVGNVEFAGGIVAAGFLTGAVLGLLRPLAEEGGYRGAAIAGGTAGATVTLGLVAAVVVFGTANMSPWAWATLVLFGGAGGALLGIEARLLQRASDRAERGEPPLVCAALRSFLPGWIWVTGRELLLVGTCVMLVPAFLCLLLALGADVVVDRSTYLRMVPLGAVLYALVIFGRVLGR